MKNKLLIFTVFSLFYVVSSCRKDLTGSPITIAIESNEAISYFKIVKACGSMSDPSVSMQAIYWDDLESGNYTFDLTKEESDNPCFKIVGTVAANSDTVGKTIINIEAFFTEHGNIVGFQDVELKRPHGEYKIDYQFRPETYLE